MMYVKTKALILHLQTSSYILWGDEILADIPSRLEGEDQQDKLSIEPTKLVLGRPGLTTKLLCLANCLV